MSDSIETLEGRMKEYEAIECARKSDNGVLMARYDGRAFHTYTRGLPRPFDPRIHVCMKAATEALVDDLHPTVAYTQSDEIVLAWAKAPPFGGRYQKIASVGASIASAVFSHETVAVGLQRKMLPAFDGRAFAMPSRKIALDYFLWRESDAVRNSFEAACRSIRSHKAMHGKDLKWMREQLLSEGIDWNDYPTHFKRGIYLQRASEERMLTFEERMKIQEIHRPPADMKFTRSIIKVLDIRPLSRQPESIIDVVLPEPMEK